MNDESKPSGERIAQERIAKFLSRAGVASRREAERMIAAGRVAVNGKTLDTPATLVSARDTVEVDGALIGGPERVRLWRYHKPAGLVVTHNDERDRETVFDALPDDLPRVISVGRLDLNSEGLLLLTNSGELARQLELPATGWSRHYRARAYGRVTQEQLDTLRRGIEINGKRTGPIEATLERQQKDNVWVSVTIREGKNREVRRAMETLDLRVNRLIRTSYGPFQLGNLDKGKVEEVKPRTLKDQVGHLVEVELPRQTRSGKPAAKPGSRASNSRASNKAKARNYPQRPPSRSKQRTKGPKR